MTSISDFRYWIWDFDGTLYDSYPSIVSSFEHALHKQNIYVPKDELYNNIKKSVGYALQYYSDRNSIDEKQFNEDRLHYEVEDCYSIKQYEGTKKCLEAIKNLGGYNYLYTHRNFVAIDFLKNDGLMELFDGTVTYEDGFSPKPAPDALLSMINTYSIKKDLAVMVGDRDIDIMAGINAGISTILFDPEGFYDSLNIAYRYKDMKKLTKDILSPNKNINN